MPDTDPAYLDCIAGTEAKSDVELTVDFVVSGRQLLYRIFPSVSDTVALVPYNHIIVPRLFSITHDTSGQEIAYRENASVQEAWSAGRKPDTSCITEYKIAISSAAPYENSFAVDECFEVTETGQYTVRASSKDVQLVLTGTDGVSPVHGLSVARLVGRSSSFFYDSTSIRPLRSTVSDEYSDSNKIAGPFTKLHDLCGLHSTWRSHSDYGLSDCLMELYYGSGTGDVQKNAESLGRLHELSEHYRAAVDDPNVDVKSFATEMDIDLHNKFYKTMKTDPDKKILTNYKKLVRAVVRTMFPNEKWIMYQAMPNIRFHLPGTLTIPPHRDCDIGKDRTPHPAGERNFLFTFSRAEKTSSMILEARPGFGDWVFMEQDAGALLHFYGNQSVHLNTANQTGRTRVSFDFRVISLHDFYLHQNSFETRHNSAREVYSLVPGSYYEVMPLMEGNDSLIMQMRPSFGIEEAESCYSYVRSDAFLTEHRKSRELEQVLCDFIGCKHAMLNCNGTLAISSALSTLGIGVGDQVLVPTYTMVATANAVRLLGAVPVLVDVDSETNTITPDIVAPFLDDNSGFSIRCVIHVSLNNRAKGLHQLVEMCRKKDVKIIEDAAQSLGVRLGGKHLGTFGDVGTFSFSSPKIISMGQGGLVVTDDDEIAARLRKNKDFGRRQPGVEEYEEFGTNMKITDLQAVVGLEQMKKLGGRINKMRLIQATYRELLGKYMLQYDHEGWIPWFIEIFLDNAGLRDGLSDWLKDIGIGTRKVYPSIHLQQSYTSMDNASAGAAKRGESSEIKLPIPGFLGDRLARMLQMEGSLDAVIRNHVCAKPTAERVMHTGLWLPSYSGLELSTVRDIALAALAYLRTPAALRAMKDKSFETRHLELEASRGVLFDSTPSPSKIAIP